MDQIKRFCLENNLPWGEHAEADFQLYLELLERFNQAMNLIGPLSSELIVRDLLIDSLASVVAKPPRGHILDVGTGAGLPGIPIKILFPEWPLTLIEPRQKRATFLKIVRTRLGMDRVTIEQERIENVARTRFDYVISKAFQPPLLWMETASQWVTTEGAVVCLTRAYEKEALISKASELGFYLDATVNNVQELIEATTGPATQNKPLGARDKRDARSVYVFRRHS